MDILSGDAELPEADIVLVKEVTQHLPNSDVIRMLDRLSQYNCVVHCSGGLGEPNCDIVMGDCRPVDLSLPPFSRNARTVLEYGDVYRVQLMERD